ncbi:MAG: hypothetical protein OXU51_02420, partial [Candidatus Poribacteria bacterium]|nr:hypothetical protein [Candidatus Poribacteria bacterium]
PMRKRIHSWFPIVLLLLIATFGYAVRAKNALQTSCRRSPEICYPKPTPPCEYICPNVDTR